MNVKSNYYKPLEVDTFRRNYAEKSGYSLKRNQSPVAVKPILHVAISSDTSTDSTHEDHYAVPDTRLRSSVIPLDSRPYLGPPGPSYVAQSYYDDSRLYNREIRNKSQKLSCEFDDEKATRTFTKHISFEPPIMKTAPSELKQVTFQRSPKPVFGTENYFVGKRIAGRVVNPKTPMIKSYWEANIQREEKLKEEANNVRPRKTFGFPRWRSNDALSASLVASKSNAMIHQNAETPKKLQKGKSLDSLMMQLDYQPWYDRNQIREAISRESIANLGATKDKFENGALMRNNNRHHDSTTSSSLYDSPIQHIQLKVDQRYPVNFPKEKNNDYFKYENGQSLEPKEKNSVQHRQEKQVVQKKLPGESKINQKFSDANLTNEQEIFLLFIKQNVDLVGGLGIIIPDGVKNIMNELQWRKVELRPVYEEESRRLTAEFKSYQPQNVQVQNNKSGRYVKNPAAVNGNANHRIISRKTFDMSNKQMPENRRPIMQDVDREKAGDSLIAAEIRMLRDREEELRRSRSELGLPNLEDTIEIWRNGFVFTI
ncbi:unnamed protein product [Enterobius vermicularis]|uniref:Uncharacterized protein n=1 Tax=Enterobius vermicularis TaxID=51028 RepID=A0A0N4VJK3_ENTVE|nr:unnamed protein product [Enterobius vermicularis]